MKLVHDVRCVLRIAEVLVKTSKLCGHLVDEHAPEMSAAISRQEYRR